MHPYLNISRDLLVTTVHVITPSFTTSSRVQTQVIAYHKDINCKSTSLLNDKAPKYTLVQIEVNSLMTPENCNSSFPL